MPPDTGDQIPLKTQYKTVVSYPKVLHAIQPGYPLDEIENRCHFEGSRFVAHNVQATASRWPLWPSGSRGRRGESRISLLRVALRQLLAAL